MGYAPTEVIDGLTAAAGGAICCLGTSPTIRQCVLDDNLADGAGNQVAYGGGLFSDGGSPLIEGCSFTRNGASGFVVSAPSDFVGAAIGGAICCLGGSPVIQGCTINGNTATGGNSFGDAEDGGGGGIHCDGAAQIQDCNITNNLATGDKHRLELTGRGIGGGIDCTGQTTILNCQLHSNQAPNNWSNFGSLGGGICRRGTTLIGDCDITYNNSDWGDSWGNSMYYTGGGGIYCEGVVTVDHCLIAGNQTHELGGGIHAVGASSLAVTNCTIIGNHADARETAAPTGGGILCESALIRNCLIADNFGCWGGGLASLNPGSGEVTVVGCTIAGNSAYYGNGGMCMWCKATDVTNCIIWGNTATEPDEPGARRLPPRSATAASKVGSVAAQAIYRLIRFSRPRTVSMAIRPLGPTTTITLPMARHVSMPAIPATRPLPVKPTSTAGLASCMAGLIWGLVSSSWPATLIVTGRPTWQT